MKADIYPLYGGYWGYLAAPYRDTLEQCLAWRARKEAEAEMNAGGAEVDIDATRAAEAELGLQRT